MKVTLQGTIHVQRTDHRAWGQADLVSYCCVYLASLSRSLCLCRTPGRQPMNMGQKSGSISQEYTEVFNPGCTLLSSREVFLKIDC